MKKLGLAAILLLVTLLGTLALAYHEYLSIQEDPSLGSYLADTEGKSLYIFTNDVAGEGTSACYGGCAGAWPPLLVDSAELAGHDDFMGDLSVLTRTDGTLQVTYNGMPLYYFAGDTKAGDITGHEVGGVWFLASYEAAETAEPVRETYVGY